MGKVAVPFHQIHSTARTSPDSSFLRLALLLRAIDRLQFFGQVANFAGPNGQRRTLERVGCNAPVGTRTAILKAVQNSGNWATNRPTISRSSSGLSMVYCARWARSKMTWDAFVRPDLLAAACATAPTLLHFGALESSKAWTVIGRERKWAVF